jgi:protoporphyrinogen oxidase
MKEVVVIGGGLAGLVVADKLQDNGFKVTIVEKADDIGGMCRSKIVNLKDGGRAIYDMGPHKFAPCADVAKDYFLKYIKDPITVPITGAVYLKNRILSYPVKITEILKNFPFIGINCGLSFIIKSMWHEDGTYANYIRKRVGSYTYDFVFKDYADKVWGNPSTLDWELARTRFVTPKLTDMVMAIITGKNTLTFKDFIYPNVCIGVFVKKIEAKIRDNGGVILKNTMPLSYDGKELKVSDGKKESSFKEPIIVSTIKPKDMARAMSLSSKPLSMLEYKTVNLFYFLIKGRRPCNTWLFYPEKSIAFNRTSINFHPRAAEKNNFILCVEVTQKKKDVPDITRSDIEDKLCEIYGIKKDDILDMWNDYLSGAYPIYHFGFKNDILSVLEMIESHGNIFCLGRHACHNYNNMDHTIIEATDLAEIISKGKSIDAWDHKRRTYDWRIVD